MLHLYIHIYAFGRHFFRKHLIIDCVCTWIKLTNMLNIFNLIAKISCRSSIYHPALGDKKYFFQTITLK